MRFPDRGARAAKATPASGDTPRAPFTGATVGRALAILRRESAGWNAPILTLVAAERDDPFLTLIGCILSLRTRDETTAVAAERLFRRAATPEAILKLKPAALMRLIYPVGFYRTKTRV